MKLLIIAGAALIFGGIASLAYFFSPVRILLQSTLGQQKPNLLIPTISAAAILIGAAILFATRNKPAPAEVSQ
jgi:hypothetical protein